MKPKQPEPKTEIVWRNPYKQGTREARVETERVVREAVEEMREEERRRRG